jgi:thiol:disulfide interchange protein DsbC
MLEGTMRKTFVLLFSFITILSCSDSPSFGFEAKGQDCSKCHTLTPHEARDLLKSLYPDVKVIEVGTSPVKASWEILIEAGKRKGLVYIDFSKKHALLGSIISIKERKNLTQERFAELNKVDVSQIPLEDAVVMGDPKARIRVIVFTDPD